MADQEGTPVVVVAGDVTVDWNLAYHHPTGADPRATGSVRDQGCLSGQRGGAALLRDVINEVAQDPDGKSKFDVPEIYSLPAESTFSPNDPMYHHSFALWDRDETDEAFYRDHDRWYGVNPRGRAATDKTTSPVDQSPQPPGKSPPSSEVHQKDSENKDVKTKDIERDHTKRRVWRVRHFLGFCRSDNTTISKHVLPEKSSLLVLDDADYGFRDDPGSNCVLKKLLSDGNTPPPWVVLKISRNVGNGGLLKYLNDRKYCGQTIVILTVNDLRSTQAVQIPRSLSWEQTAEDVAWALCNNVHLSQLRRCRHVVVSLGTAGAVLMSDEQKSEEKLKLIYDPRVLEGDWERHGWGRMMGYTVTLTASLVQQMMRSSRDPDLVAGIRAGIAAMRELYRSGYRCGCPNCSQDFYGYQHLKDDGGENRETEGAHLKKDKTQEHAPALVFPKEYVAGFLTYLQDNPQNVDNEKISYPILIPYPRHRKTDKSWTILEERIKNEIVRNKKTTKDLAIGTAKEVARKGLSKVAIGIPRLEIGDLYTVDRREIEALRSVQGLIRDYAWGGSVSHPLNLAVFGPPGAGKSFAVEQVATSVSRSSNVAQAADSAPSGVDIKMMTFNLSQFDGPEALHGALHQVRDVVLSGKLPLVFWDEFDTKLVKQRLGWLRYFLAPMQDGKFVEREITHTIGRCIFVFAGGTFASMSEFRGPGRDEVDVEKQSQGRQEAKVPDFISRLQGYIDVFGINPLDHADFLYLIRRASLLRSLLYRHERLLFWEAPERYVAGRDSKGDLQIEDGVLEALIRTKDYRHGSRSMDAIVTMSTLVGKRTFDRSSLPPRHLLNLHVDADDFETVLEEAECRHLDRNNLPARVTRWVRGIVQHDEK